MNARKHVWNNSVAANVQGAVTDKEDLHFFFVRRNQTKFRTSNARTSLYPRPAAPLPLHPPSPLPNIPQNSSRPRASAVSLLYTDQMNRVHSFEEAPCSFTLAPCVAVERLEGKLVKNVFHATKYQGDTAIIIPPFFQNAGRGTERIWGETLPSPQPLVINWPGLNDKEKIELIPILASTENWILLTYPLGAKNKSQPPLMESQRIARAEGKCSRHKGWWREGKDEFQHKKPYPRNDPHNPTGIPRRRE